MPSEMVNDSDAEQVNIDILLVDDRRENLLALEAVLSSPQYRLVKVHSGEEALKYLLDNDPAIILLDVQMPVLDGFETAAIIKNNERTREIPIIFLTALNKDERFVHKGYDHGAVDYLYKPFDAHILKSKVSVFAELYRKTQRLVRMEQQLRESEERERARKIAQLELKHLRREQAAQQKYRDLVEGIDHGMVWSADPTLERVSFVSESAARILGYAPEAWPAVSGFFLGHVHPGDRAALTEAVKDLIASRGDVGIDHRMVGAEGQIIWLHTGMRLGKEAGANEIHGLSVDITQLKRVEELLQKSKQRSEFAAEASLLLSESLDMDTILARIGELAVPRLADWYSIDVVDEAGEFGTDAAVGAGRTTEIGGKIAERLSQAAAGKWGAANVIRGGEPEIYSEAFESDALEELADDSAVKTMHRLGLRSLMIVPLSARGRILGAMSFATRSPGAVYEATDLAMAEDLARRVSVAMDNANLYKEAQTAIRARDEFLSIASHELRTPLTPLKIQTQGLMRTLSRAPLSEISPEKIARMLESSDRQITRLSKLIDDLLDLSRISIGRLNLTFEEFDLQDLVVETVERFRHQLDEAKCVLETSCSGSPLVRWDRFRIEQVIINLLVNAIKYGAGQPISIKVESTTHSVRVIVEDHGIGIAPQDQARIFGRFERAVSGSHFGGLGLGLYIVKQIVTSHGGKIGVESRLGRGSTFLVEIPVEGVFTHVHHSEAGLPASGAAVAH